MVALRAARLGIYHAAWLIDSAQVAPILGDPILGDPILGDPILGDPILGDPIPGDPIPGDPAAEALAASAEALTGVARVTMQACGVRAMTPELPLHRYYRLTAAETTRYGPPAALWRLAGAARLARAPSLS